jgi:hypothetical protein
MAKKTKKKIGGPFLAGAFFCETVIEDKGDDTLSAIRIIDQVNILVPADAPPDFPSEQNRIRVPVVAILFFRTGDAKGSHSVRVEMESPTGKKNPPFEQVLPFSDVEHGGANIRLNMTIGVVKGGLFLYDVFLDNKLVTRMPLKINVDREKPAQSDENTPPPQ